MVGADLAGRVLECLPKAGVGTGERCAHLGVRHAQVLDSTLVEPFRVLTNRRVTTRANRGDDLADGEDRLVTIALGQRECRDEVAGEATEIETHEQARSS